MVTLGSENRIFGADSFLESGKYPKSTFQELARTFGQKYDSDLMKKFKEERFVTNELVSDSRGTVAWKITRPAYDKDAEKEEIIYSEEVLAMLLAYVKFLAEKQAGGQVRDCVITIPSWFTYDQRLMVKDAAEGLAGLNILQLVHENTAAATMFGIDQKLEKDKNLTVMFYNMGGMDTEVSIVQYSLVDVTEKKTSPHIRILGEASVKDLGSKDLDNVMVNLLAKKFNELPERQGKDDVLTNQRATKRLQKEVVKIKEILSANIQASVKVAELLDYVTLQLMLSREEVEAASAGFFDRVSIPAEEALKQAGLTKDDID